MARTVIRCRSTGNYSISHHNAGALSDIHTGRIFCPYCIAEHVWSSVETGNSDSGGEPHSARRKTRVRQAS